MHVDLWLQADQLRELQGTAALDKMEGKVQVPADAPTQVRRLLSHLSAPHEGNWRCEMEVPVDAPTHVCGESW
jgi:hypothetical protein